MPALPVRFAPRRGDVVWASAPYRRNGWAAPGDGSYYHKGGVFFGTGAAGMAFMAGGMLATGIGNSIRRSKAQMDTAPRWMHIDAGQLFVSRCGFYFASQTSFGDWTWEPVRSMELVDLGHVIMAGRSTTGDVRWLISTIAAELLFTLWARNCHPGHPQFGSRAWLTNDWFACMEQAGYALPPNLSGRWWPAKGHPFGNGNIIAASVAENPVPQPDQAALPKSSQG